MQIKTFVSGLRAMAAIFFRHSKGSVRDLLLVHENRDTCEHKDSGRAQWIHQLNEVKGAYAISDWAQQRIAIRSEDHISLLINRAADIRKL
jgi:hypothetical protein